MTRSAIRFFPPVAPSLDGLHHSGAAAANARVADEASATLRSILSGDSLYERLLLRAAAGAGKSSVLRRLVTDAVAHPGARRVAVTAFTNKQTYPLARELGLQLGQERVCLLVAESRQTEVPTETSSAASVVTRVDRISDEARVVISPIHKLGSHSAQQFVDALGLGVNGFSAFDVMFVDEAWQVASHLFDRVEKHAHIHVGVGDVGQLPPLEIGTNPWRGDTGYNPYRAWPTAYEFGDARTWVRELPSVWRPPASALALWRAFYPNWAEMHCVTAPEDRWVNLGPMTPRAASVWTQVASGVPTLLEVDGLPPAEAPDVDRPLIEVVEHLLDELFAASFSMAFRELDDKGEPDGRVSTETPGKAHRDPLVAFLATRNQAVDDAEAAVGRLVTRHALLENDLIASTVDSWQGQTNGFTVALHPLSGAVRLDDFNSAFGRLAVACTRATHGVLLVSRPGLDRLLTEAPARPGTAIGEPGFRTLPRQTHQRILDALARGAT